MIDTHTHIYLPLFDDEAADSTPFRGRCDAVDRAVEAGVEKMVFPNIDRASIEPMLALHSLRPHNTFMAMGLHPTEVKENWRDELKACLDVLDGNPSSFVAVGEVGIDLYWDKTFQNQQMTVFDSQVADACRLGLPVIIHCREGLDQTLEVLSGHPGAQAVFHSFGGTVADVERILAQGDFYFGFNGIITFKNSRLDDTVAAVPSDRILSETDSPYLSPVPFRGRTNESSRLPFIVQRIAQVKGLSMEEADRLTTDNARRFFRI